MEVGGGVGGDVDAPDDRLKLRAKRKTDDRRSSSSLKKLNVNQMQLTENLRLVELVASNAVLR